MRLSLADLTKRLVPTTLVRTLADADRAHIIATLRETNGVVGGRNGAAAKLGLPRTTLLARMEKLGLLRSAAPPTPDRPDVFTQAAPSHVAHAHV